MAPSGCGRRPCLAQPPLSRSADCGRRDKDSEYERGLALRQRRLERHAPGAAWPRAGQMSGDGNLSRVAGPRMSVRWPRGRGTGLRMSGRCPGAKSVVGDSHSFPVPGALWGVVCPSVLQWRPLGLLLLSDSPRRMTKCRKRVKMHGDSKCDSTPHFNSSNSTNPKIMRNFPQTTCRRGILMLVEWDVRQGFRRNPNHIIEDSNRYYICEFLAWLIFKGE